MLEPPLPNSGLQRSYGVDFATLSWIPSLVDGGFKWEFPTISGPKSFYYEDTQEMDANLQTQPYMSHDHVNSKPAFDQAL